MVRHSTHLMKRTFKKYTAYWARFKRCRSVEHAEQATIVALREHIFSIERVPAAAMSR